MRKDVMRSEVQNPGEVLPACVCVERIDRQHVALLFPVFHANGENISIKFLPSEGGKTCFNRLFLLKAGRLGQGVSDFDIIHATRKEMP